MDYTTLSLADVRAGLDQIAREAQATFGALGTRELNWKPDASRWSVAQCLEHLLKANQLMLNAAEVALSGTVPRTIWQRLPVLPGLFGRLMVRSQAPGGARKYKADPQAQPASSDIAADIVQRFIEQHRETVRRVQAVDERAAASTIMTSPFVKVITYSVLDGWRLVLAHDRRHFEQASRVTLSEGFPRS
jgi:DinB family protein